MSEHDVDIRKLNNLSIYQLREVGAKVGVRNPTTLRSAELRQNIRDVVMGKIKPYLKNKRGRPHKEIISAEEWDELVGFGNSFELCNSNNMLSLYATNSSVYPHDPNQIYEGYVLQIKGELILAIGSADSLRINKYARIERNVPNCSILRQGDKITATLYPTDDDCIAPSVSEIKSINGITDFAEITNPNQPTPIIDENSNKTKPQSFHFVYPQLEFLNEEYPISYGQRVMFVGCDKLCGQDFLANTLAKNLSQNYKVVYLSCNKMPEAKMTFNNSVDYFFSTFDITPRNISFNFEIAFARAQNLSKKYDTILIIDDLSDVMQSYIKVFADKNDDSQTDYDDILHQIKTMFANSGINSNGSLTIFTFASIQDNQQISDYIHKLDEILNCRFVLNQEAFLNDSNDFIAREESWVAKPKRTIAN